MSFRPNDLLEISTFQTRLHGGLIFQHMNFEAHIQIKADLVQRIKGLGNRWEQRGLERSGNCYYPGRKHQVRKSLRTTNKGVSIQWAGSHFDSRNLRAASLCCLLKPCSAPWPCAITSTPSGFDQDFLIRAAQIELWWSSQNNHRWKDVLIQSVHKTILI